MLRKRKSKEEGKSSSKRGCGGGSSSLVPLPAGVFDPAFDAASRVDFRPSSSQRVVIEPLSEGELLGAVVELMTRGAMLAWNALSWAPVEKVVTYCVNWLRSRMRRPSFVVRWKH
ncbi:hypothetical protein V8G54_006410 [Vigna mungo]|uniref:Uncharacterized protein n=1 Tax=Vigna mungo TaxID=3915 RepID=A0AAQ3P394_VIGMU